MKFTKLRIPELIIIEPAVFTDERGYFLESYNKKVFSRNGVTIDFVQENHVYSHKNTLRGLHFQHPPFAQDKLVRVISGAALDIAVDIRFGSPTYGKWEAVKLTSENKIIFLIPKGFAHGFIALTDDVHFVYKTSNYYAPDFEGGLYWNDPDIGIDWSVNTPVLSEKDEKLPLLKDFRSPFKYEPN